MNKQKHLTLDSRIIIETKLNEGESFKAISRFLNKDCTTISKEVKNHISFKKSGAYGKSFNDCRLAFQRKCSAQMVCQECTSRKNRFCWSCGKCFSSCILYEKYVCPKLSKPPYVCNGCSERNKCSLEKHLYRTSYAQKEYELVRSKSRSGFALSENELKQMEDIVSPLLIKDNLFITLQAIIAESPRGGIYSILKTTVNSTSAQHATKYSKTQLLLVF